MVVFNKNILLSLFDLKILK